MNSLQSLFIHLLAATTLILGTALIQAEESRTARIIGGVSTDQAYPWMVAITFNETVASGYSAYERQFCGGTLIDERWVLTAAHCVDEAKADQTSVVIGVYDLSSDSEVQGNEYQVAKFYVHPQYSTRPDGGAVNDIALMELQTPAAGVETVQLITAGEFDTLKAEAATATPQGSHPLKLGTELTVMGWGNRSKYSEDFPEKLYSVELALMSQDDCEQLYASTWSIGAAFCATAPKAYENKDSCQGDSGGPIFWRGQGNWIQAGIVSWGEGCADFTKGGLYADVAELRSFIDDAMAGKIPGKLQGDGYREPSNESSSGGAPTLLLLVGLLGLLGARRID